MTNRRVRRGCVAALGLLVGALTAAPPGATSSGRAPVARGPVLIAEVYEPHGAVLGGYYRVSANGRSLLQLPAALRTAEQLTWSRDGTTVAYTVRAESLVSVVVHVRIAATGEDRVVAEAGDTLASPTLSPNGKRLVFRKRTQPGSPAALFLVRADGSGLRRLTTPPEVVGDEDRWPSWSPDGDKIAFVRAAPPETTALSVLDLPSGKIRRLVVEHSPQQGPIGALSWSPDSTRIAFVDHVGVHTIGATGRDRRLVVSAPKRVTSASWSPDGKAIALALRSKPYPVSPYRNRTYLVAPDGRGLHPLPLAEDLNVAPCCWSTTA